MSALFQKPGQLQTLVLLVVILLLFLQFYVQTHQDIGEVASGSWNGQSSEDNFGPMYEEHKEKLEPSYTNDLLKSPSTELRIASPSSKSTPERPGIQDKTELSNTGGIQESPNVEDEQQLPNEEDEQGSTNTEQTQSHEGTSRPATPPTDEYIALCIAVREQQVDLDEFLIHHYHHMNVSRFYIMDDRSDPPLSSYQNYTIPRSALTFNHYNEEDASKLAPGRMQWWIYDECINLYQDQHTWMGFIDIDEFLEIRTDETLDGILRGLEKDPHIGALSINWKTHTSSGLLERPDSARQTFVHCIDEDLDRARDQSTNRHVKSFVKTQLFDGLISPHLFELKEEAISVGEDEKPFGPGIGWRQPITRDRLALHHYAVKSKQEFEEKLARWVNDAPVRSWLFWDNMHAGKPTHCPEMTRYHP